MIFAAPFSGTLSSGISGTVHPEYSERIVFTNEDASCPQTEVHLHETLATEFKGTNPNFSHFKIEQFMSSSYYSIFRFYYNNKMEAVSSTYPYEWGGRIAYFLARGDYYAVPNFGKKVLFRGDSIMAWPNYLYSWNYPTILYYKNMGVIGCQIDSSTLYILQ